MDPFVDDRFFGLKFVLVVLVFVGCLSKGGGGNSVAFDVDLLCVLLLVVPPVVAVLVPATVVDVEPAPPITEPPLLVAALVLWLLLLLFWLLIIPPRFDCIWSFVVVVVEDIDDAAPWNDSNGISCSGNGGDKRSYKANSCVHLIRLSRFVVW